MINNFQPTHYNNFDPDTQEIDLPGQLGRRNSGGESWVCDVWHVANLAVLVVSPYFV